jgi:cephalosporin hydroxylase
MDPYLHFVEERRSRIAANPKNQALTAAARTFMLESIAARYSYNFEWLGRPVIQYPQDIVAIQEIIWDVKPDLIIETGIAHGGSLILSASMLALLEYCEAAQRGQPLDPRSPRRHVLGIDIEIRPHNRAAIEAHPLAHHIHMIEGSSIAPEVIDEVHRTAARFRSVMVFLDSDHTHDHVFAELEAYAPLVTPGSYCVVFDTIIEDLPPGMFPNRPWGEGNNPKTAVAAFLESTASAPRSGTDGLPLAFVRDRSIEQRLVITVAPGGFLRRQPR